MGERIRQILNTAPLVLTEGSIVERIRRDADLSCDPHVIHAAMIYDSVGRRRLERIYRLYLDIGAEYDLPMQISTPTWRASPRRLLAAGYDDPARVNADGAALVKEIRASYGGDAAQIQICGLIGCAGDAYRPGDALPAEDAARYHQLQVSALADAGVDFLMAATLPAFCEALGIAQAMASTRVPYLLSFVLRPGGTLLDGTPLRKAISGIDEQAARRPEAYLINCVHPETFASALAHELQHDPRTSRRIRGLQANTSRLSPEELDGRAELDTVEPAAFASAMLDVRERFDLRVLGGCCGTDERHIRAIAAEYRRRGAGVWPGRLG